MKVAEYASFLNVPFPMHFLEQEESWNLFRQKAFDKKVCPMKFDNVAKEVVKNCKELPLVTSTIAGTLSGKRTLDEWWKVAQAVSSLANLDDYQHPSASEPERIVPQDRRWVSVCSYRGQDHFKLLRVLDLGRLRLTSFPSELSDLVSLSFLPDDGSPSHTTMMQLPNGIWKMSQLRHLHCRSIYLNSPPKISADDVKYRVLENLKTVTGLSPLCCTKEIFHGIKNVRKLGILGDRNEFCREPKCLDNLIYLHELEALHIEFYFGYFSYGSGRCLPQPSSFPPNLKKLTLLRTCLSWESMTMISRLPKLEVLQLKTDAFGDSIGLEKTVWKVTDRGFPKLKFLLLEGLSLDHWRAIDDFFPCLEHIIIRKCLRLKHIPRGFADSMTLQLIELHQCSSSLVTSADRIRQEQLECLGNDILKVEAFDTIRGM
ncbi:hypothetical protein BC332_34431 [Capsicum chinense]|nr:hypothetical protein BC332_34431 [Capsicum chinense]